MPQATFVQDGDAIDFTPTVDVAAGAVIVVGDVVGVTKRDIKANTLGALALRGVFDVPKTSGGGVTFAFGDRIFWDDTNKLPTADDGGGANKHLGTAVRDATDADSIVRVRLIG